MGASQVLCLTQHHINLGIGAMLKPAVSGSLPNQIYISPILKGVCCQHNAQVAQGTLQTAARDERCEAFGEGIILARRGGREPWKA